MFYGEKKTRLLNAFFYTQVYGAQSGSNTSFYSNRNTVRPFRSLSTNHSRTRASNVSYTRCSRANIPSSNFSPNNIFLLERVSIKNSHKRNDLNNTIFKKKKKVCNENFAESEKLLLSSSSSSLTTRLNRITFTGVQSICASLTITIATKRFAVNPKNPINPNAIAAPMYITGLT